MGRSYYKLITLSNAHVVSDQAGFPVVISFVSDAAIGGHARSGGEDIAFFDTDGTTALPFRVVTPYAVVGGLATATYEVKVNLTAGASKVIRVAYGDAGQAATNSTTLSIANQTCHISFDAPTVSGTVASDTSGNGHNATLSGGLLGTTGGVIGNAVTPVAGKYAYVNPGLGAAANAITVMAWARYPSGGNPVYSSVVQNHISAWVGIIHSGGGTDKATITWDGTEYDTIGGTLTRGAWHLFTLQAAGAAGANLWTNTSKTLITTPAGGQNLSGSWSIGMDEDSYQTWNDYIDDVRFFSATKSDDFIAAMYYFGKDRSQVSLGTEQSTGGGGGTVPTAFYRLLLMN